MFTGSSQGERLECGYVNRLKILLTGMPRMNDPMTLHTPRWLNVLVATLAEGVLLIVTVAIITAMWLPAYLTSRQTSDAGEHGHEEMVGLFPRGK
jgi:hypothetical protein